MSGRWTFSNVSTPPQRTGQLSSSFASPSRVEALFDAQPGTSFIEDTSLLDASADNGMQCAVALEGTPSEEDNIPLRQCQSCQDTYRLRNSLKRVEEQYVSEIESLRLELQEAVAQRGLAVKERNDLLTSADTDLARRLQAEQEAREIYIEMRNISSERKALQRRVLELERQGAADRNHFLQMTSILIADAETAVRRQLEATEKDENVLLRQLRTAEFARISVLESLKPSSTPPRWAYATVELPVADRSYTCRNRSSDFSSGYSSPGPSDEGRGRRMCSPRHAQKRALSAPVEVQRNLCASESNDGAHYAATATRCIPEIAPVLAGAQAAVIDDSAGVRVKKLEWSLEQQRSSYEVQLAEERALTSEMQEEIDDLIENELVLLEANGRVALQREFSETVADLLRELLAHLGDNLSARPRFSEEVHTASETLPRRTSNTCCGTEMAISCKDEVCPTPKAVPAMPAETGETSVACTALLADFTSVLDETRKGVCDVGETVTVCQGALGKVGTQQDRMESLLRQVLERLEYQNSQAEETCAALRHFSRISTHNDDALFRAVGKVEAAVKAQSHSAVKTGDIETDGQWGSRHGSIYAFPSKELRTEGRGSEAAADIHPPNSTKHSDATLLPSVPASPSYSVNCVVAEEKLFDPSRIHVDVNVAAVQMAGFVDYDTVSECASRAVSQTPFDIFE